MNGHKRICQRLYCRVVPRPSQEQLAAIGERIAQQMKALDMNPRMLGERLGLTDQSIRNYIKGAREPDLNTLGKIETELRMFPGELKTMLLGITGDRPAMTVPEAIDADPMLGEVGKASMHSLYRSLRGKA